MEAPGTAPGSDRLITRLVYRHSRPSPAPHYIGQADCGEKGLLTLFEPEREAGAMLTGICEVRGGIAAVADGPSPVDQGPRGGKLQLAVDG